MSDNVDETKERLARAIPHLFSNSGGNNSVQFHGGGIAIWACVTACIMMLSMTFVLVFMHFDSNGRIERRLDKLENKQDQDRANVADDIKGIRAYINAGLVKPREK